MRSLEDLEAIADSLLKQAQELPPGLDRNDALKDIGRLRKRLDAFKGLQGRDSKLPSCK